MRCQAVLIILISLFTNVVGTSAQEAAEQPLELPVEISEAGNDYLRSLRLRNINPDVTYYSPAHPPPELDTTLKPQQQPSQPSGGSRDITTEVRWVTGLVTGGLLLLIAFMFVRFGGGMAISFKRSAQNPGRDHADKRGQGQAPVWAEKLSSLEEILQTRDRRRALVLLAQKALATTVAANGVLMQRSWTARDALAHIPERQSHLDALRALVMSSERVQFGGRDVSEDEFRNHVAGCRQLLGSGAS